MRKSLNYPAGAAAVLALVLAAAVLPTRAQEGEFDPDDFGKESAQSVTVGDSTAAFDKFAHARRMERLQQWNIAADLYQEILKDFPDRVVQSHTDPKTGYIDQYTSVRFKVIELMSKWPAEGLNAYRAKYEPIAAALLASARMDEANQIAKLEEVFSFYFITDSGKAAALRLIDIYFEQGQFSAAAWRGEMLVQYHPNLGADKAAVLFRSAVAYHLMGDGEKAKALEAKLKAQHADATGTVQGQTVQLADALKAELANARVAPQRMAVAGGKPGAKLFSIPLSKPPKPNPNDPNNPARFGLPQAPTSGIGIFPVESNGQLFFQDGQRIYAVDIESGLPLPGWAQTYGGDRKGRYLAAVAPAPRSTPMTVTVTESNVLAVMGAPINSQMAVFTGQPAAASNTRLVCLDRASGKELWSAQTRQLPASAKTIQGINLIGTPLVNADTVYIAARGGRGTFEDCHLLAYELATGKFKWSCFISSATVGNPMYGGMPQNRESYVDLAYDAGRIYVLTNLGTLGAVDAYSGAIVWLSLYPREELSANARMMMQGIPQQAKPIRPWAMNPIIQNDGKLFVLPSDGLFLMIYDAGSGLEAKRIAMADLENSHTLLGVNGNRLFACQDRRAVCIDWNAYTLKKAASPVWASAEFDSIQGRGFVSGESIIIPTRSGLLALAADRGGRIVGKYPAGGASWNEKDTGNVLVTESHVVVAGAETVDVYTDTQMARVKLDREEAAAPDDPNPRLRYAEVMFIGGDRELAGTKLAEAAERLGGLKNLKPGPARDRLFNDCMQFAEQNGFASAEVSKFTREMYDRAGAAASGASQQVNYRLSRAKFEAATRNHADEVRLYQEILADPALRAVNVSGAEAAEARLAGTMAEEAIARVLSSGVAEAYAPYEKAAGDALAAALLAGDADAFVSIAQLYPNSKTAPAALLAAADAYEKAGAPFDANVVLRKILSKYQSAAEKPLVLESLARNYLAMGRHEPQALRYLSQGEKAFGANKLTRPLKVANGPDLSGMTFADASAALRKHNRTVLQAPLPEFRALPATKKDAQPPFKPEIPELTMAGVDTLLTPLATHARYDRVIAWSAERGLIALSPGRAQPIATSKQLADKPAGYAWADDTVIAWSGNQVVAWKPDGSQELWKVDLGAVPTIEMPDGEKKDPADTDDNEEGAPVRQRVKFGGGGVGIGLAGVGVVPAANAPAAAGGGSEQISHVRPTFDRVIVSTTKGRLFALKLKDGQVAWNVRLTQNFTQSRLLANDDFTVVVGPSDDPQKWFLAVLDSTTGEAVRDRILFAPNNLAQTIINVALSDDGIMVYTVYDRMVGVDLYEPSRKQIWQSQGIASIGGRTSYQGMQGERQLVISEGRVLALSSMGMFIQAFSLETGQPLPLGPGKVGSLQTQARNVPNASLMAAGSQVYFVSPQKIQAYNIEKVEQNWTDPPFGEKLNYRQVFLGQDHLLVVADATAPGTPAPAVQPSGAMTNVRILGFSRAKGSNGESGMGNVYHALPADAQVTGVVPVDGGLYYHTNDAKLHYLAGNR